MLIKAMREVAQRVGAESEKSQGQNPEGYLKDKLKKKRKKKEDWEWELKEEEREEEEGGEEEKEEKGQREEEGEEEQKRMTSNKGTRKEPETQGYPGEHCFAGAKVRACFKKEGTNAAQQPGTVRTGHLARGGWGGRGQGHGHQPMKGESRYQTNSWEGHALQEVKLQIWGETRASRGW